MLASQRTRDLVLRWHTSKFGMFLKYNVVMGNEKTV